MRPGDPLRAAAAIAAICLLLAPTRSAIARGGDLAIADSLRLTGRYAEARRAYAALAGKHAAAAALGTARCMATVGETEKAIETLGAVAAKQPADAALRAELATLEFERGNREAAQRHVDAALALDPDQCAARFIAAELHRVAGRLDEASDGYRWFVRFYNRARDSIADPERLLWVGRGAAQYARWSRNSGQFTMLVNTLYPKARRLDRNFWPSHLEAGLLFIEKYNPVDAKAELDSALAINPNAAELHAAFAMIAVERGAYDSARAGIDRALAINPLLKVAHRLDADLAMTVFGPTRAIPILERARRLDPADEETLGRLAAVYGAVDGLKDTLATGCLSCAAPPGTRLRALLDEAIGRNPHCGEVFAALAEALDRLRKYPHAARWYEEARRRMPQLVAVPGQLGMVWMRLAEEERATALLEEAFRVDPFNARLKNTLDVLELLKGYGTIETEHFVIRHDRGRDTLLARYAARWLEDEVWPDVTTRLGFRPPAKSLIEIFSSANGTSGHAWFSARMVGLPFIGTVAACAGKIVAMASPTDTRTGFDWAQTLKHEFVHVVNLQQTGFNIPHWYTEGLAVMHEDAPRPPEWEPILARRLAAGRLFTLANIDFGFMRPGAEEWSLAYCQAELYAEYIAATYGKDANAKMIAAYGANLDTPRALERSFGVGVDAFEAGYRGYVTSVVAARDTLAEAARAGAERAGASGRLELAREALARGDAAEAARAALRTLHLDVRNPEAHAILAETAAAAGRYERAVEEFEAAIQLGTKRQEWLLGQARACAAARRTEGARDALRDRLETDPEYPGARELIESLR